ncbi:hypothetical protein [Campylobacter concisus]|uniref:hypothetical protein n=1 Tax=Campylobacter concisus TaxID=199 RepID=UPI0011E6EC49|nr:hypothetical protein [Campylobacter concisus]
MIGLSELLNLTNSDTGDDYEFMAGGQFDFYQAGSLGYSAFNLPSPDLRSFFIAQVGNLSGAIIGLNEDFAEYVLMPMIIAINQPDYDTSLNMLIDGVNAAANITFSKPKSSNRDNRFGRIDGNGFANLQKGDYTGLKEFLSEMRNDSYAENIAEDIGKMYGGVVGQALAGMLYDGIVNGRFNAVNVAEAMYQNMKSTMTSLAIQNTLSALGTTISPIGVAVAASLINAIVTEVFELAVGLDNHFGFGGDLNAVVGNTAFYDRPMSFGEFLQDKFSGWFGIPDAVIGQTDYNGNITGVRVGKQLYGYKMEQTFNDALHGRPGTKTLTSLDPARAAMQNFAHNKLEGIRSQNSLMTNMRMDSLGRLNYEINTRTSLQNAGFDTALSDMAFSATQQITKSLLDKVVAFDFNAFNIAPAGASESDHANASTTARENTYTGSNEWANTATKLASIMRNGGNGLGVSVDKNGNFSFSNTPAGNMVEAMGLVGFGGAKINYGLASKVAAALAAAKTTIEKQKAVEKAEAERNSQRDSYGQKTRGWNDHSTGFGYTTSNGRLNRDSSGRRTHSSERTGLGKKSRGQKSRERQANKNGRK